MGVIIACYAAFNYLVYILTSKKNLHSCHIFIMSGVIQMKASR